MYSTFKKLAQNSVFYTFANSIEAFSPMVLAIVLTRLLEPTEYGIWILFIALVSFLRPLINLSVQDALRMHFFQLSTSDRANFIWSCFCLSIICTLVILAALLTFSDSVSELLNFPQYWLSAIPTAALLYALFYFLLAYYQFSQRRRKYLLLHVVQTSASLVAIAVLVYQGFSWQGVIAGKMVGLSFGVVVGCWWLTQSLDMSAAIRRVPQLVRLAKFGLLYLPTGMGMVAIPLTDRLIVTKILGLGENGLFGAASLFGSAVFVVINGFIHAWMPWLFKRLGDTSAGKRELLVVSTAFMIVMPIVGFIASILAHYVAPIIIGNSFSDAFPLIPWAIAGTISMGYFFHNQAYLHFKKAIIPMSISSLLCITLNAVLSYYGAIYYGVQGVFAATVVSFLAAAILSGIFIFVKPSNNNVLSGESANA